MNIDKLVENIRETVERHRIEPGVYRRWLWNNASGGRQLGVNEYGCADAANILYTIGCFEGDPAARENWVRTMQGMQDPETGLFHEATHHPFHTTAHVAAALELFDARPLYPVKAMLPYLDRDRLYAFLEGLDWEKIPGRSLTRARGCSRRWSSPARQTRSGRTGTSAGCANAATRSPASATARSTARTPWRTTCTDGSITCSTMSTPAARCPIRTK